MMGEEIRNFVLLANKLSLEVFVQKDDFCYRLDRKLDLSFVRELVNKALMTPAEVTENLPPSSTNSSPLTNNPATCRR